MVGPTITGDWPIIARRRTDVSRIHHRVTRSAPALLRFFSSGADRENRWMYDIGSPESLTPRR